MNKIDCCNALKDLRGFIGPSQLRAVSEGSRGEEKQFFFDKMCELAAIVKRMPTTGAQDGKGKDAVAFLHYFKGGADWYIIEKDMGAADDSPSDFQCQAFGLADIFGDGGELGYISIPELLENGVELDFHFTPKTLRECYPHI